MNFKLKTTQFFFYIAAIFIITAASAFAQSSTASRSDSNALGLEVQAKQAAVLLELLDETLVKTYGCVDELGTSSDALWSGTGDVDITTCEDPEDDPTAEEHATTPMPTCTGLNEIPFWVDDTTGWTCKALTGISQNCDINLDILGECTATGIVADGSTTTVTCVGTTGNCSADVTCTAGVATSTNEVCAAPTDCSNTVVGGSGCTSPQFIAHSVTDSWSCDGTYVGNCSATCNDGIVSGATNGCTAPPFSNCFDVVGGPGCNTSQSVNHGDTNSITCDAGYTGNCTAECDNGTFVNTVNNCVAVPVYIGTWIDGPCSGACGGGAGTISASTCSTGNIADCDPATNPDGSACTNSALCAVDCAYTESIGACYVATGMWSYAAPGVCHGGCGDCIGQLRDHTFTITTPASGGGIACPVDYSSVCSGPTCSCFIPETFITMADGTLKPIIEVKVGERVKAADGAVNTVLDTRIHDYSGNLYSINGSDDFVTGSHPFKTTEGWKAFEPKKAATVNPTLNITQLQKGDVLLTENGETPVKHVSFRVKKGIKVYNLHLDGTQEYYADGFLVHNK